MSSFAFGGALGIVYDGVRLLRLFMGEQVTRKSMERLYEKKIPLLGRSIAKPEQRKNQKN